MKIEKWCGHDIRFIEHNGEWWAILKDICDALDLRTSDVTIRLEPQMMERIRVKVSENDTTNVRSKGDNKYRWMVITNELGVYETLFASRRPEAKKFRMWTASVMKKLRKSVGLEEYQVMRMTEPDIQADIDHILDTLYWDENKKCVMQSVTIQGGDVEQVPFEEE